MGEGTGKAELPEDPAFPGRHFRFLWKWPTSTKAYRSWWLIVLKTWLQVLFDIHAPDDMDYREVQLTLFTHKPFGFHRVTFAWRWR